MKYSWPTIALGTSVGAAVIVVTLAIVKMSMDDAPQQNARQVQEQALPQSAGTQETVEALQPTQQRAREQLGKALETFGVETDKLADPGPLPPTLQGAEPSVRLAIDRQGNLVATPELKQLFEFYLGAIEEEPLDILMVRIQRDLAHRLEEPALSQARDVLRDYVDYRAALADIPMAVPAHSQDDFEVDVLAARLATLEGLRSEHFDPNVADAFFTLDRVQDEYTLQRLRVEQNQAMSSAQKSAAIRALDETLPEPLREVRARVTQHAEVYAQVEAIEERGGSAEERFAVRQQAYGSDVAEELAELDRKRAEWNRRVNEFDQQRHQIRRSGLSHEDQDRAIQTLLASGFDELEQIRVRALLGAPPL